MWCYCVGKRDVWCHCIGKGFMVLLYKKQGCVLARQHRCSRYNVIILSAGLLSFKNEIVHL